MRQGYTTLPNDDNGGGGTSSSSANSSPQTIFDRVRKMWDKPSNNESAPLLDRKHMRLEPPKRTTTKVTLTAVLLVFTMLLFGAGIAVWIETEPVFETRPLSETERLVLNLPSNDSIHDHFHVYASKVHLAGSDTDRQQAEWTRDKWIEMGVFNTTIETYYPLLTQPKEQRFALVTGPEDLRFEATMHEKVLVGEDDDETKTHPAAFHAYSKNGSALGPVVYANYGGLKDFQLLLDRGIALAGTIALMRAGNGIPDGTKIRVAEKFGCIGALIYPDPIDDGPFNKHGFPHTHPAEPYPNGPWRPSSSIRSGSVEFSSLASGDPLTPGWAAIRNTTRLDMDESQVLPNIPSLPLSYHDALSLLKAMQGRGTLGDISWKGGLPDVSYYSGPTEGNAQLVNIVDNKVAPVWNVIGVMHGSQEPDHAVILGMHERDSFCMMTMLIFFFLKAIDVMHGDTVQSTRLQDQL
ncbi:n-acetylated-alpha-linked acidic dipeptidase [Lichtheimia corymbifera JMRC:FSU:9682]|uniref:N-acetylated-alpha-linked acidic dipeptidase n=1 Tax=Lichtheimia corymbifera JMRC:FSU:9682 TaxID=1263082 RepID=A0A068S0L1_9FUNG|nr:n-acetylated-alpha-linked acidic dipeptidase [Lichtheimia corymbifera JMRC:FSU:9682]